MDNTLAIEHLNKPFHPQVARRQLFWVASGARNLIAILLSFDELLANHFRRLSPRAGKWRPLDRIGAIGHFHPAGGRSIGAGDDQIINRLPIAILEVNGLPTEKMSRTGHDVADGNAASLCFLKA